VAVFVDARSRRAFLAGIALISKSVADWGNIPDKCCVSPALRLNVTLMSKGHGKLQRRLLQILNAEARIFETFELVALVFEVSAQDDQEEIFVTAAQIVAVRRALQKLASEGAVFDLGYDGRRKAWANERVGLRYKIRMMQLQNARLADVGTTDTDSFMRRFKEMEPFLKRAAELGVDYDSGWG
jgi:hypothetical protein